MGEGSGLFYFWSLTFNSIFARWLWHFRLSLSAGYFTFETQHALLLEVKLVHSFLILYLYSASSWRKNPKHNSHASNTIHRENNNHWVHRPGNWQRIGCGIVCWVEEWLIVMYCGCGCCTNGLSSILTLSWGAGTATVADGLHRRGLLPLPRFRDVPRQQGLVWPQVGEDGILFSSFLPLLWDLFRNSSSKITWGTEGSLH